MSKAYQPRYIKVRFFWAKQLFWLEHTRNPGFAGCPSCSSTHAWTDRQTGRHIPIFFFFNAAPSQWHLWLGDIKKYTSPFFFQCSPFSVTLVTRWHWWHQEKHKSKKAAIVTKTCWWHWWLGDIRKCTSKIFLVQPFLGDTGDLVTTKNTYLDFF